MLSKKNYILTKDMDNEEQIKRAKYFIEYLKSEVESYNKQYSSEIKALCMMFDESAVLMPSPDSTITQIGYETIQIYVKDKIVYLEFDDEVAMIGLMSDSKLDRTGLIFEGDPVLLVKDDLKSAEKEFTPLKMYKNNEWYDFSDDDE